MNEFLINLDYFVEFPLYFVSIIFGYVAMLQYVGFDTYTQYKYIISDNLYIIALMQERKKYRKMFPFYKNKILKYNLAIHRMAHLLI